MVASLSATQPHSAALTGTQVPLSASALSQGAAALADVAGPTMRGAAERLSDPGTPLATASQVTGMEETASQRQQPTDALLTTFPPVSSTLAGAVEVEQQQLLAVRAITSTFTSKARPTFSEQNVRGLWAAATWRLRDLAVPWAAAAVLQGMSATTPGTAGELAVLCILRGRQLELVADSRAAGGHLVLRYGGRRRKGDGHSAPPHPTPTRHQTAPTATPPTEAEALAPSEEAAAEEEPAERLVWPGWQPAGPSWWLGKEEPVVRLPAHAWAEHINQPISSPIISKHDHRDCEGAAGRAVAADEPSWRAGAWDGSTSAAGRRKGADGSAAGVLPAVACGAVGSEEEDDDFTLRLAKCAALGWRDESPSNPADVTSQDSTPSHFGVAMVAALEMEGWSGMLRLELLGQQSCEPGWFAAEAPTREAVESAQALLDSNAAVEESLKGRPLADGLAAALAVDGIDLNGPEGSTADTAIGLLRTAEALGDAAYAAEVLDLLPPRLKEHLAGDELNYASLFAGGGGRSVSFRLDSEESGAVWRGEAVECVPAFAAIHRVNLPDTPMTVHRMTAENPLPPGFMAGVRCTSIAAGPPCQPFSAAGSGAGASDSRNGIPALLAAVAQLRPLTVEIENVVGLLKFTDVLKLVVSAMEDMGYYLGLHVLNAAEYGVPQRRVRAFIMGSLLGPIDAPPPVAGKAAGMPFKTVGDAIGEGTSFKAFSTYDSQLQLTKEQAFRAVRLDAMSGCAVPRELRPDAPARTLTAANLANNLGLMQRLRMADGSLQRPSVEQAAALQSFPADFRFPRELISERQAFIAIGNAVPSELGKHLARVTRRHVEEGRRLYRQVVALARRHEAPQVASLRFADPPAPVWREGPLPVRERVERRAGAETLRRHGTPASMECGSRTQGDGAGEPAYPRPAAESHTAPAAPAAQQDEGERDCAFPAPWNDLVRCSSTAAQLPLLARRVAAESIAEGVQRYDRLMAMATAQHGADGPRVQQAKGEHRPSGVATPTARRSSASGLRRLAVQRTKEAHAARDVAPAETPSADPPPPEAAADYGGSTSGVAVGAVQVQRTQADEREVLQASSGHVHMQPSTSHASQPATPNRQRAAMPGVAAGQQMQTAAEPSGDADPSAGGGAPGVSTSELVSDERVSAPRASIGDASERNSAMPQAEAPRRALANALLQVEATAHAMPGRASAKARVHADADAGSYANAMLHAMSHAHVLADAMSHANADAMSHANADAMSHANANAMSRANADAMPHTDAMSHAGPHTTADAMSMHAHASLDDHSERVGATSHSMTQPASAAYKHERAERPRGMAVSMTGGDRGQRARQQWC